nr:MAG TPA: hypothetical protein [Caudoviricetes sp.]
MFCPKFGTKLCTIYGTKPYKLSRFLMFGTKFGTKLCTLFGTKGLTPDKSWVIIDLY